MSGGRRFSSCRPRWPPCASPRFAKSCPRRRGVYNTAPHALRALLRYDFAVRSESIGCSRARPQVGLKPSPALQSRSAAWHFSLSSQPRGLTSRAGPLSHVVSQCPFFFQHRENRGVLEEALTSCCTSNCCDYSSRITLRHDARRDPPRDVSPAGSERASSQWLQAAQRNCTRRRARSAWGAVLYTPLRRGCDLSKQIEAQEGSRGTRARSGVPPDMSLEALCQVLVLNKNQNQPQRERLY